MSLNEQILRRRIRRNGSWSTIIGLMTACVATLIGILSGLEPDIILWRSLTSGVLMGLLCSFGISVIYFANAPG
jgi:hypothetical protein